MSAESARGHLCASGPNSPTSTVNAIVTWPCTGSSEPRVPAPRTSLWKRSSGRTVNSNFNAAGSRRPRRLSSEWSGPPDLDAALDYYNRLVDHVRGPHSGDGGRPRAERQRCPRSSAAFGPRSRPMDSKRLMVEFELVEPRDLLPHGSPTWERRLAKALGRRRPMLSPVSAEDRVKPSASPRYRW